MRTEKKKAIREYVTEDILIKYLVKHNMSKAALSRMLGINAVTLGNYVKEIGFDLQEQKEKYALNHYKKMIKSEREPSKIRYIKGSKPLAIIK